MILERSESVALAFVGVLETEGKPIGKPYFAWKTIGKPIGKPVRWLENHRLKACFQDLTIWFPNVSAKKSQETSKNHMFFWEHLDCSMSSKRDLFGMFQAMGC